MTRSACSGGDCMSAAVRADVAEHRRIPLDARSAWEAALDGIPHGIAHTWGYCRAIQLSSALPTFLYQFDGVGGRVVCPLAERRYQGYPDLVTPYGFGGFVGETPSPGFAERWVEFAAAAGYVCGYLQLSPLAAGEGYADPADTRSVNTVFLLDLRPSPETLFANLHQNRKRQLRDPVAAGATLVWDQARLSAFFLEEYAAFADRVRAAPVYRFTPTTLSALCAMEGVFLVGAESDGRLEAVMMFGHTAYAGDYLFGVALPDGRRHATRLIWSGIERLRALGVPLLNLGGGARPNDGIADFKRRFGAREAPLCSLRQVYRPDVFDRLCVAAGAAPDAVGYFPPYHAP